MDDPWGSSPWADEVQIQRSASTLADTGEAPATPVQTSTLAFESKQHTNSPWDNEDDDGFGDWASVPEVKTTRGGFDSTAHGWNGIPEAEGDAYAPIAIREEGISPTSVAPVLGKMEDPWTTEEGTIEATGNVDSMEEGREEKAATRPSIGFPQGAGAGVLDYYDTEKHVPAEADTPGSSEGNDGSESTRTTPHFQKIEQPPETELVHSRPSSSPSERSQHDEQSQESPRTSIDDEPKRPQTTRKVSTKIKELVEHFDGLAKQDIGESKEAEINTRANDSDEEMDDFGDFEGEQSGAEEAFEADVTPTQVSKPGAKDYGPIDFKLDLSILSKIYPNLRKDTLEEKLFIPDVVPADSFSTLEERKTWYRVSRYGPMRKHNAGDDERYVRVNWTQSKIREETLKIVGRWLEEDRLSGRVVLGGSSKGSSVFGWNDPKAVGVPLSQAFASNRPKKRIQEPLKAVKDPEIPREWPKGLVKTRTRSNTRSPPKAPRRTSLKLNSTEEDTKARNQSPSSHFDWSSASQNLPPSKSELRTQEGARPVSDLGVVTANLPPPGIIPIPKSQVNPDPPSVLHSRSQSQVPSSSKRPLAPPIIFDQDDDEWGEMVSSPVTPDPPILPANTLRHKNSQSLGTAFVTPKFQGQNGFTDIWGSPAEKSEALPSKPQRIAVMTDPWASADFSIFDGGLTASKPHAVEPKPLKSVSFQTPGPVTQPKGHQKTKEELDQDRIVQKVVKGLPDLSYMLRR